MTKKQAEWRVFQALAKRGMGAAKAEIETIGKKDNLVKLMLSNKLFSKVFIKETV